MYANVVHIMDPRGIPLSGQAGSVPCQRWKGRVCRAGFSFFAKTSDASTKHDDPDGESLFNEIEKLKPSQFEKRVKSCIVDGQGRGLFAKTFIPPGQKVMSLPRDVIIDTKFARRESQILSSVGSMVAEELPDWTVLTLWLMERLNTDGYKDAYNTYCQLLPREIRNVLEWGDDEINMLEGSYLKTVAGDIVSAAHATSNEILDVMQRVEGHEVMLHDIVNKKKIYYALSILLSRLVRLQENDGTEIEALCPYLDFANHSSLSTTFLTLEGDAVVLRADRLYKSKEQIYINYGQKTNGELLLSYGFLPEENEFDGCLVPMSLLSSANEHISGLKHVLSPKEVDRIFLLKMSALPEGILRFAACIASEPNSMQEAEGLYDALMHNSTDQSVDQELKDRGRKWLLQYCRNRAKSYKMPMELLKSYLGKASNDTELRISDTKAQIAHVLLGEQRILARTLFIIQQNK